MAKTEKNDLLVEAFLRCVGTVGWAQCTPALLARQAKVPLARAKAFLASPHAVCRKLADTITGKTLRGYRHDQQNSPRDALFEVLMLRFDVLQNHRQAMQNLSSAARRDPQLALAILQAIPPQMSALLAAAHCRDSAPLNTIALTAIYLVVFPVWSRDESADLARTMAALDKQLNRVEAVRHKLSFFYKSTSCT